MKLGEKILEYRKKKGLSQEQLAEKIDVTRQTISNWELGETSPNPEQLKKLSSELNVSIDELLDNDIQNVLVEKVSSTEKLSKTILQILRFFVLMLVLGVVFVLFYIVFNVLIPKDYGREIEESIYCKLYGEEHGITINYYETTGDIKDTGSDGYFYDILDLVKYDDAHQVFNVINDYVKMNGGSCIRFSDRYLDDYVDMEIVEGTLTKTGATIKILEDEDLDLTYGDSFFIEKFDKEENTFKKLEVFCKNCTFNMPAYMVDPNNPLELKQEWGLLYGELSKGTYRLVKEVFFDSDRPVDESNKFYVTVEFEIE